MNSENLNSALKNLPNTSSATLQQNAISWLFFAIGAAAVIMIIFSGVKMSMSAGNPGEVQKAKQILIYSIIGLIVSILAYAIVSIVLKEVG